MATWQPTNKRFLGDGDRAIEAVFADYDAAGGDATFEANHIFAAHFTMNLEADHDNTFDAADSQLKVQGTANGIDFDDIPGAIYTIPLTTAGSFKWVASGDYGLFRGYRLVLTVNTSTAGNVTGIKMTGI